MMNTVQSTTQWEDLPKELLQIIGKHLDSRIDVFRFRAVSTSWRSVVSPSFRQLSNSPPLNLPSPFNGAATLSLVTICRLENESKTSACLVKVVESNSGELQLLSLPSADGQIRHFIGTPIHKSLNMLDLRLIQLFKAHVLTLNHTPLFKTFKKVVLFYNKGILVLHNFSGKLGFWGFGDKEWTNLGKEGSYYDDICVLNKNNNQIYVIDNLGIISWIDTSLNLVQYSPPLCGCGQLKSLVESEGSFYVVDSYLEEQEAQAQAQQWLLDSGTRVDMKVYKLDEEWGMWVQVNSLGDRVFVLGNELNFSVNVREYPGCHGNCIYFIDKSRTRTIFVARFFRIEDGSIRTVECFPTYRRLFSPAMMFPFSTSSSDDAMP